MARLFPSSRRIAAAAGGVMLGTLAVAAPAAATPPHGGNPPGNNGTVKVDGVEFDTHPDNEPHPGCVFEIDFYGFDAGSSADVEFRAQPPTGDGVILTDTVDLGDTNAAGGGSEAGYDNSTRTYDLGGEGLLDGYEPHPRQGYHLKLTIHAEGSQGADTKHKVFWVEDCAGAVATSEETPPPRKEEKVAEQSAPILDEQALGEERTRAAQGGPASAAAPVPAAPRVAGVQVTRPAAAPTVAVAELARTGGPLGALAATAGALLTGGAALVGVAHRRRRDT